MTKNRILGFIAASLIASAFAVAADTRNESSTLPIERETTTTAEAKPSIGLMLGTFVPDDGTVATPNLGIDFMFQPRIPYAFGIEVSHAEPESTVTGERLKHTTVLAKAQYNFGGTIPVLRSSYLGLGAGYMIQKSDTQFAAAPIAGFDIPLKDENGKSHLSLGANAKYLYVEGNEDVDSNAVSLNGVLKFWY